MKPKKPNTKVGTGINIRPVEKKALIFLAHQDGHSMIAPVVRKLINERMKSELGPDWEIQIIAESPDLASTK